MKLLKQFFLGLLMAGFFGAAFGDNMPMSLTDMSDGTQAMGVSFKQINPSLVEIYVDQDRALAAIPMMQMLGAINPAITQTQINMAPNSFSYFVGLFNAVGIVQSIYQNTKDDKCHFVMYVNISNDYGNTEKHELVSFDFNRAIYNKINWDNYDQSDLSKVAPHFRYSSWLEQSIKEEKLRQ